MKPILFDFQALGVDARALAKVEQLFEKAGLSVVSKDVADQVKRIAGISYREATLTFADSQTVVFRIKQTGDIYQVAVDGKNVPIRSQDDPEAAVTEIVGMLRAGAKKFQVALARTKMPPPAGMKSSRVKQLESLTARSAALDVEIDGAKHRLMELGVPVPESVNAA